MAAGEGSAGAGLCPPAARRSPHPAAGGRWGGVQVRTPCKEEKAARFAGGHPEPTCVYIAAGFTPAGIRGSACLSFPIHLWDACGAKRHLDCAGARAVRVTEAGPCFLWADQPRRHC